MIITLSAKNKLGFVPNYMFVIEKSKKDLEHFGETKSKGTMFSIYLKDIEKLYEKIKIGLDHET